MVKVHTIRERMCEDARRRGIGSGEGLDDLRCRYQHLLLRWLSICFHAYKQLHTFQLFGLKKNAGSDWMSSMVALGYHSW